MSDTFTLNSSENLFRNQVHIYEPNYLEAQASVFDDILAFVVGFIMGFVILFIFYKIIILAILGGIIIGIVNIFISRQRTVSKRKYNLRIQFFDLLEAMSVAMRAGSPPFKALESAKNDLSLTYSQDSDIIVELSIIIGKFNNGIPLSEAFCNFASRSGLEDIDSFAIIYRTIEGKSSRADEIIRETQQIIADKLEIEMEIDTLMTAAKTEVNIMLILPLVILGVIGYAGAGFMDAIYTTVVGRLVSTGGFIIFIVSYMMARKFSDIKL